MNLLQFEYFLELAKQENVTSTAETLHVSQPAVSNMLKKLESELGVPLFDRKGKTLKLNENGKAFQKTISSLFEILERNQQKMLYRDKMAVQEISIGFRASESRFAPFFDHFLSQHPNISFRLISNQQTVKNDPKDTLDFFFTGRKIHIQNMQYIAIPYSEPKNAFILLSKKHRLSHKSILHPHEIENEPMIIVSPHANAYLKEYTILQNNGIHPNLCSITDDRFIMLNMVSQGNIIALMPYIDALFAQTHPDFVAIPLSEDQQLHYHNSEVYLAWNPNRQLSDAALEFRDCFFQYYHLSEANIHHLP